MRLRPSRRLVVGVALTAVPLIWLGLLLPGPMVDARSSADKSSASVPQRIPWKTSRVVGSPDPPPPFTAARVYPQATFNHPLLLARAPGLDRLFVGEQGGVLYSLAGQADARPELVFDLRRDLSKRNPRPPSSRFESLYALAFHPRFEQNRTCFLCYTLAHTDRKIPNLPEGTRISRFQMTPTDPPRIDPESEEIVLTFLQGGHNGCDLHFGPDGYLYISTGDAASPNPPDPRNTGQDVSDLLSSILRIDVDHRDPGKNYAIPKDNPFVDLKDARPEVWAYGFRNPWRMSFDRKTGDLWVGDVGWELWEMVHKIERGGNYGWSITEARQPIKPNQTPGPTPIRPPAIELPHTIAASVTGGYVYRGRKFPELQGAYVFGDWEFRRLWAARFHQGRLKSLDEITRPTVRVVAFGDDAAGELYFLDYDHGTVHTLERNTGRGRNKDFPTNLSETGLFASVKDQVPAPGVLPFQINARQWQDGATAEYWVALPGTSGVVVYPEEGKPIPSQVYWHKFRLHFPKDAVLVKTISLTTGAGEAAKPRWVETQLLHFDGLDWRGYTFAWRDDQSDADLVPVAGSEKVFQVPDKVHPGGKREYVWPFLSRTQCMQCHNQWPQYALAFNLAQLNREVPDGHGGRAQQLVRLSELGYLRRKSLTDKDEPPYDATLAAQEDALPDPFRPSSGSQAERARAYLHVNCSHCHRFGGGGAVSFELVYNKKLTALSVVDVPPTRGDFGLPDARLIARGHPERSTLFYRMAKFGRDRMPQIGSEIPDEAGLKLVGEWIAALGDSSISLHRPQAEEEIRKRLERPEDALWLARLVGREELAPPQRERLLALAAKLPFGAVRDLFEGFLPSEGGERKLGPNPRPAVILSQRGDRERGEALFWSPSIQCGNCHKVGDKGVGLGPDLTTIGKQRSREELLESLLEPSRKIEPAFTTYLLSTVRGASYTGLLVRRDAKEVVLRDAQNKEVTVAARDVEMLQPSQVSLMPAGLLAPLTRQQAADLLQYLTTRK
jgi:putative heme-binding domain-containing protein